MAVVAVLRNLSRSRLSVVGVVKNRYNPLLGVGVVKNRSSNRLSVVGIVEN